ncbi:MAG: outer membrane beta-barrel protein [Prevotella sp.]|nr:outer membrane beta-barrel protein [Prevotella sp.]
MMAVPVVLLMLLTCFCAQAQEDPEYKAEIGGGLGMVAYLGDFNGSLTKNMQPMFAAVAKYRMNPRMALALNVGFGKLKGSSENLNTWYPLGDKKIEFDNSLVDVGIRYEYNFWPFGTGREYRGAKPFTPFLAVGLGTTFVSKDGGSVFAANMPIGVGVKYKMATRLNLSLEWMMHFSGSDKLDQIEDPYGIKSNGLFKNTDCYSTVQVSLTYDIFAKCKTCNNDL